MVLGFESVFKTSKDFNEIYLPLTFISSTLAKEVARHGGDLSAMLAPIVSAKLAEKIK